MHQLILGVVCDLCRVEVQLCTNTAQLSKNLTVFLFIFGHRLFYIIPYESFVAATTYFYTTCYTHICIKYFIISVKLTVFSSLCLLFPEMTRQSCLAFVLKIHSFSFVSFLKQTNKNKHPTHDKTTTVKRRQLHMLHLSSWFCFALLQIEISMISKTLTDVQHLETTVWKLLYMSWQNTWNSQDETYFYTHWKCTINVFNLPFNLWLVSPFIVFCLIMITAIAVSAAKPTRTTMNHHDQPGNRIKSAQPLPLRNELDVVSLMRHTESNEFNLALTFIFVILVTTSFFIYVVCKCYATSIWCAYVL